MVSIDLGTITRSLDPAEVEIAEEWDRNFLYRARELEGECDHSYFEVIVPTILRLISIKAPGRRVVDAGCGLGFLSYLVNRANYYVDGIDISYNSINYALHSFPNINFFHSSIIDFANFRENSFDICIANMVLHNIIHLDENLSAIHRLLTDGGLFVGSIPHPNYWMIHKGFCIPCFAYYCGEAIYKLPFKIRNGLVHPSPITYFHRSVEFYFSSFIKNGFKVLHIYEVSDHFNSQKDLLFFALRKE